MRQEQKPGLLSDCESAASAGLRMLSSVLIELASNVYIAGKSAAESAIVLSPRQYLSQLWEAAEPSYWVGSVNRGGEEKDSDVTMFTCILRKMDVTIGRNGSDGYGSDFRRWSVMAALYLQEGSLKKTA